MKGQKTLPEEYRIRVSGNFATEAFGLHDKKLCTVCEEARCPNRPVCYGKKRVTFLLLGSECTRKCAFCAISHNKKPAPPAIDEILKVVQYAKENLLRSVVLTMVTRDDLFDGGASFIASAVGALKKTLPKISVEVLVSDFGGNEQAIDTLLCADISIFAHNIETVKLLSPRIRDKASYKKSLRVLSYVHNVSPKIPIKSGLMVGFGETPEQVYKTLYDLKNVGVSIVTIGQYMPPSSRQIPVVEYTRKDRFLEYERMGVQLGFSTVASGPFVRSSFI